MKAMKAMLLTDRVASGSLNRLSIHYGWPDKLNPVLVPPLTPLVLEPSAWNESLIAGLRSSFDSQVLAYISVCEVRGDVPHYKAALLSDHLRINGKAKRNEYWDTHVMDVRQLHWQEILHKLVHKAIDMGFDGVFLDTVDRCEDDDLPQDVAESCCRSLVEFMSQIKTRYGCSLLQNGGMKRLRYLAEDYVEAVCWEGFPVPHSWPAGFPKELLSVSSWQKDSGVRIIAIHQLDPGVLSPTAHTLRWFQRVADELGFGVCIALHNYIGLPNKT